MDCRTVRERIALYVYDDLGADEGEALREHLAQCGECAAEVERVAEARRGLNAFTPIESPADVAAIAAWATAKRAPRVATLRSALVGVAAGVLAFAALSAAGVQVRFGANDSVSASRTLPADIANTVDARLEVALERFDDLAFAWQTAQEERFADVLRVLEVASERQRIREASRARELVDGVMHAVAFPNQPPHRP
jgi:Putative zinc-finger